MVTSFVGDRKREREGRRREEILYVDRRENRYVKG